MHDTGIGLAAENLDAGVQHVSMAMMLELLGNEVRTAHDGLQAVEAVARHRPLAKPVSLPELEQLLEELEARRR